MVRPNQVSAAEIPEGHWDVAVVGAGPAGSTAALHLARAGRSVLLLDKASFPREKVCGDGLIADALAALRRADLYDAVREAGHTVTRARVVSPSRVELEVPGECVTLRRERLDAILADGAQRAGACFARGSVRSLEPREGLVRLDLAEPPKASLTARAVLLATGADLGLLKPLGLVEREAPDALAMRHYVRSDLLLEELVFSFDRSVLPGYAWIFPMGGGEFNVGCGVFRSSRGAETVNLKETLEAFVRSFPLAGELMASGEPLSPLRGARLRCGLSGTKAAALPGVLLAGEAAGTTFPFSGEGIGKAMETGELAARALHEALGDGDPSSAGPRYQALLDGLRPKYRAYEAAERWMGRAWLADLVFRRARSSPYLQRSLAGLANETVDPRDVFSPKGLLRSLLE